MMSKSRQQEHERFAGGLTTFQTRTMVESLDADALVDDMLFAAIKQSDQYWVPNSEHTPVISFAKRKITMFLHLKQNDNTDFELLFSHNHHKQSIVNNRFIIFDKFAQNEGDYFGKFSRLYADLLIVKGQLRTNPQIQAYFLLTDTQTDQQMYRIFKFELQQRGNFMRVTDTIQQWQQHWKIRQAFIKIITVPIQKNVVEESELPFTDWYRPILEQHATQLRTLKMHPQLRFDSSTMKVVKHPWTIIMDKCCNLFNTPTTIIPIPSSYVVTLGEIVCLQMQNGVAGMDGTPKYSCLVQVGPLVPDYFVERRTTWKHLICLFEKSFKFYIVLQRQLIGYDEEFPIETLLHPFMDDVHPPPDKMEIFEVRHYYSSIYVLCPFG